MFSKPKTYISNGLYCIKYSLFSCHIFIFWWIFYEIQTEIGNIWQLAYFFHISILASCFIIWDIRIINHIFCILGHLAPNIGFLGSAQHASIGGSGRFACSVHPLRMTDLVVSIGGSGRFACSVHSLRMLGLVVFTLTFCAYVYAYVTSILASR